MDEKKIAQLRAISPIDGRYAKTTEIFTEIFSEHGLQKRRLKAEVLWLMFLIDILRLVKPENLSATNHRIGQIAHNYSLENTEAIKTIDSTINHDVKAVEYYLRQKLDVVGLSELKEWVHFGLTSEDITNIAIAMMASDGREVIIDNLNDLIINSLEELAYKNKALPMLAHTHGQPASPTTLGKEMIVFCDSLGEELQILRNLPIKAKLNCASGNFSALHAAFPAIRWIEQSQRFIMHYARFEPNIFTVQTNSYNYLCAMMDSLKRIAEITVNLDRDFWTYISMNYFVQIPKEGETGSSTMPHKVNPIDFENSEGNAEFAGAIAEAFARKLLITRLQRDLTDSTFLRNLGLPFAHLLIALKSTIRGLGKVVANPDKILRDLADNPAVLAEPIQTVMRMRGVDNPYDLLKSATRGKPVTLEMLHQIIDDCGQLEEGDRKRLKALRPETYTGLAEQLVDAYF